MRASPAPRNALVGPALVPLQTAIFSGEKQERLGSPPLKMAFRPPLQTLSAVVFDAYEFSRAPRESNLIMCGLGVDDGDRPVWISACS